MVSAPDYALLLGASDHFLEDADFGLDAIEVVMCKVFGQYRDRDKSDGCDARAWGQYFNEINIYEEAGGEGNMSVEKPLVRPHIIYFIMQTANFAQLPTTAVLIDATEDEDGIMDLDLPSSASTHAPPRIDGTEHRRSRILLRDHQIIPLPKMSMPYMGQFASVSLLISIEIQPHMEIFNNSVKFLIDVVLIGSILDRRP